MYFRDTNRTISSRPAERTGKPRWAHCVISVLGDRGRHAQWLGLLVVAVAAAVVRVNGIHHTGRLRRRIALTTSNANRETCCKHDFRHTRECECDVATCCTVLLYLAEVLHEEGQLLPVHFLVPVHVVCFPNLVKLFITQLFPRKLHQIVFCWSPGPVVVLQLPPCLLSYRWS